MAKRYVITGAYVTVKTMTTQGPRIVGMYAGAPWPDDAEAAATQHHLDCGLIEEVPAPAPPVEAPKVAAVVKPATAGVAAKGTESK